MNIYIDKVCIDKYVFIQTMNRLVSLLENAEPRVETKVERFSSSEGVTMLGEHLFVRIPITVTVKMKVHGHCLDCWTYNRLLKL